MNIELDLPRPQAWRWLLGLTLLLPMSVLAVLAATGVDGRPLPLSAFWILGPMAGIAVMLVLVARRQRAWIESGTLHLVSTFYRRRIPLTALDLDAARVLNLREHPEEKPRFRSNGFAVPGLISGWYRLSGWRKAFAAYGDPERVLRIDAGEFVLLLGAARPQAALDALRRARGDNR